MRSVIINSYSLPSSEYVYATYKAQAAMARMT